MYNQNIKEEFIDECVKTKLERMFSVALFNASEEYENKFNHDISEMDITEMSEMVSTLAGIQKQTAIQKICVIRKYEQWCIKKGITPKKTEIVVDEITADDVGIANIKQQMVATPQELQEQLNIYFLPEEKMTVDNIYRAYFWLAFSGIKQEDIFKIKNSDIDIKNCCIDFMQEFYPIYPEEVECLRNCVELNEFVNLNPNYNNTKQTRIKSDVLFRGARGLYSANTIRMSVSRRIKTVNETKEGVKLSYNRVWLSGMFYRMYEREQLGFPINFKSLAEKIVENKEYALTKTKSTKGSVVGKKTKDFGESYYRWKLAFCK